MTCGNGVRIRPVQCVRGTLGSDQFTILPNAICTLRAPSSSKPCRRVDCPSKWEVDAWSEVGQFFIITRRLGLWFWVVLILTITLSRIIPIPNFNPIPNLNLTLNRHPIRQWNQHNITFTHRLRFRLSADVILAQCNTS